MHHFNTRAVLNVEGPDLAKLDSAQRALLAADLAAGRARIGNIPLVQAAALLGCSKGYLNTAANLTAIDRERIVRGMTTLSAIHNGPRRRSTPRHLPYTDAELEGVVAELGADRVLLALERLTAPAPAPVVQAAE